MRKQTILLLLFCILASIAKSQIIDRAPTSNENYRAVEGGSERVPIDKTTPIPDLIKRFEKPWELVETGKGYWIGYTNNMYSIANHNDDAIKPLITFIESTNNLHAKYGAIYTLHLIGIHRKIVGQFYEEFVDKSARNALLYLLKYNDIGETIMQLLVRDPWQSDVPELMTAIKDNPSAWYIVSGLTRYKLVNCPLNGKIPDNIRSITFYYYDKNSFGQDDFDIQIKDALHSIKLLNNPAIKVDKVLFSIPTLWGIEKIGISGNHVDTNSSITNISTFFETVVSNGVFGYGNVGSKVNYYIDNNRLYICSPEIARQILMKWWSKQSIYYKEQFTHDSVLK